MENIMVIEYARRRNPSARRNYVACNELLLVGETPKK